MFFEVYRGLSKFIEVFRGLSMFIDDYQYLLRFIKVCTYKQSLYTYK